MTKASKGLNFMNLSLRKTKEMNVKKSCLNCRVKNEIDFIVTNDKKIFMNISVINRFNTGSGRKLVREHLK